MTNCVLTSKETGKKYTFKSSRDASKFLGYSRSYVTAAIMYDRPLKHKYTGEKFTIEYVKVRYSSQGNGSGSRPHIQPCSLCVNFAGGCEWSERFEPVEGWEAEPTVIGRDSYPIHSYRITYCPKYQKG